MIQQPQGSGGRVSAAFRKVLEIFKVFEEAPELGGLEKFDFFAARL